MNRVLKICCLLYVCVLSFSTGVAQVVDTARWDLNRISSWMLTQIQYPEDAYKYHTAGIEQLCLSVAWDGRVFVSSRFSTLNPAFEREIERVVRRAPRCNTPLLDIEDANKYMWNTYERVFVAEYQQYKKIKVQKSGKGETGYKSCFLRK